MKKLFSNGFFKAFLLIVTVIIITPLAVRAQEDNISLNLDSKITSNMGYRIPIVDLGFNLNKRLGNKTMLDMGADVAWARKIPGDGYWHGVSGALRIYPKKHMFGIVGLGTTKQITNYYEKRTTSFFAGGGGELDSRATTIVPTIAYYFPDMTSPNHTRRLRVSSEFFFKTQKRYGYKVNLGFDVTRFRPSNGGGPMLNGFVMKMGFGIYRKL